MGEDGDCFASLKKMKVIFGFFDISFLRIHSLYFSKKTRSDHLSVDHFFDEMVNSVIFVMKTKGNKVTHFFVVEVGSLEVEVFEGFIEVLFGRVNIFFVACVVRVCIVVVVVVGGGGIMVVFR